MQDFSFSHLPYFDEQYQKYLADPSQLEPSWRSFFEGWLLAQSLGGRKSCSLDIKVEHLIQAYRTYGHLKARFNCLIDTVAEVPELKMQTYGIEEKDLNTAIFTDGFLKEKKVPLGELIEQLEKTYCGSIGIEYMGIQNPELKQWIQEKIEPGFPIPLTAEQKLAIFQELNKAELFEVFLHTKYVGQKRFSLEGGETLIPMLKALAESLGQSSEMVIGMAHRGRLNVLANVLNKSYESIFHEFEDHYTPDLSEGTGDVKYHKGFSTNLGSKTITLCSNPSHLEAVDPVLEGLVRGKQMLKSKKEVLPVLIHGDASLAGQGVVYETLQLGGLNGYETGGTVHIVINNQIGFTTLPKDSRSTRYCTDIALSFGAPVFHVNAEDPKACVWATLLAHQIREQFHVDVFIDLNCYRKWGHNEGDEPAFTQPVQNQKIKQKKTIRTLYLEGLIHEGVMTSADAAKAEDDFRNLLEQSLAQVSSSAPSLKTKAEESLSEKVKTAVPEPLLKQLAAEFCQIPAGFNLHPKVQKLQEERLKSLSTQIDWGMGEHMAYASLLAEGVPIRISGQDSRRGTFSHRHAVWVDQQTGDCYYPLSHLKSSQARFDIFNSPLSEFAVLGFEFGYSLACPQTLVIWEAQFGDFANGAQVIIDQFIANGEQKWGQHSGLVLFLPHGYEGQGPEHSSARLERFLQLSGDDDWTVANCTTPSQLFHLLRRQAHQKLKRPLVLMTPKALLRHPLCTSPLKDCSSGTFEEVIPDPTIKSPQRVIFCSGKVYYDLLAARKNSNTALIRVEQLYPFCSQKIKDVIQSNQSATDWCWAQEESQNMGAWSAVSPQLNLLTPKPVRYIGRAESCSSATGSHALHEAELKQLLEEAFQ